MLFHEYLLQSYKDEDIILKSFDKEYTFYEINQKVNDISEGLLSEGISKGDRVIILMENGLNAICSQIACSKIGAVFIPVSPKDPVKRLTKIVENIKPSLILHEKDSAESIDADMLFRKVTDGKLDASIRKKVSFPEVNVDDSDTLYIISTSGTTGNPKGIAMSHKATVHFFQACVNHCKLTKDDNVGSIAPLQFDFSILDLGLALGSKACLTVLPQALAYKPKKLLKLLTEKKVTQLNSVPSIWSMILDYAFDSIQDLVHLKSILYAGERFPKKNIRLLKKVLPGLRVINCFGQSESIACSFHDIDDTSLESEAELSFGKGYPGNIFYIVNDDGELITAPDTPGELWLSNGSLFIGYWQNQEETDKKLIKDPFNGHNGNKVYKTGDLVVKDYHGNYYYVDRKDNQVKIQGNRVELDEITTCVLNHPSISNAITVSRQRDNKAIILLFISLVPAHSLSIEEVRHYLRLALPAYMIPDEIIIKRSLPWTLNGKIDKKQLLEDFNNNLLAQ